MPSQKTRLSEAEMQEHRACLKQLHAEGIELESPGEFEERCPLQITRGIGTARIFDLGLLDIGYVIPVCMVAGSRLTVMDYSIDSPWDEEIALRYLTERNGRYKFGRQTYMAREVLNDQLEETFTLNRGSIIQGLIIAYGCQPIPKEFRGRVAPIQLTLTDTLQREIRAEINLVVGAAEKREQRVERLRSAAYIPPENVSGAAAVAVGTNSLEPQKLGSRSLDPSFGLTHR